MTAWLNAAARFRGAGVLRPRRIVGALHYLRFPHYPGRRPLVTMAYRRARLTRDASPCAMFPEVIRGALVTPTLAGVAMASWNAVMWPNLRARRCRSRWKTP